MPHDDEWWFHRCTHSLYLLSEWEVLREAEGVAVIMHRILPNQVHIIIDLDCVGSVCRQITKLHYDALTEAQLLNFIREQRRGLRSIDSTP